MRRLRGREQAMLGLLIAIALAVGVWRLLPLLGDRGRAAVAGTGESGARKAASGIKLAEALKLDLDALAGGSVEIEIGRDPFRFAAPPPPPWRPPPPPPPPMAPPPPLGPQPPPVDVTFLGSFGPPQRRIAVFSDGKMIYNAERGDTLGGKFVVHAIGYESVDLTFVGFPEVPPERLAVGG
ncbi:MAG TPA: hypothetical protein VHR17_06335 [Thermoanaerobaculia bacterium]|jgi:hypothetical protein|nr:hypothetical protein [Thermoanaerobaculia bacterium]